MPGTTPLVHVAPASVDVAKPIADDPPPYMRPTWNAVTSVDPELAMPGSTSVACWLCELVKVSELSCFSPATGEGDGLGGMDEDDVPLPPQDNSESREMRTAVIVM